VKAILLISLNAILALSSFAQGTLRWTWTWTGTNNLNDVGSGTLITGLDKGEGTYDVIGATGTFNGHTIIGMAASINGSVSAQWLGYPLGTSGGTKMTQFAVALSDGFYEEIEVDPEVIILLPPDFTATYHVLPIASSSIFSGEGWSGSYGIFTIAPEAVPETTSVALTAIGGLSLIALRLNFKNRVKNKIIGTSQPK
jgi:hypothetical protein